MCSKDFVTCYVVLFKVTMESKINNRLFNKIHFNVRRAFFTQVHTTLSLGGLGFPPGAIWTVPDDLQSPINGEILSLKYL